MQFNKQDVYQLMSSIMEYSAENLQKLEDAEPLSTHGLTSIGAIQILLLLEEQYDLQFRDEHLTPESVYCLKNLWDILQYY